MATPLSAKPPAPEPPEVEVYDLSTPEEVARRKRRRTLLILAPLLALLLAGLGFGAKPAFRAVKAWQARRAAAQAMASTDKGDFSAASRKVQDALALKPDDPAALHAAAVLLSRVGRGREALGFWKQFEKQRPLAPSDHRDQAAALLAVDDVEAAGTQMRLAWPQGTEGTPADWRVALQLALRRRDQAEAVRLARRLVYAVASGQQRIDAALVLIASAQPDDQRTGWEAVERVSRGDHTPESLEALLLLARQAAELAQNARDGKDTPKPVVDPLEVAARIERHPLAKPQQRLFVYDLHLAINPQRHEELVKRAIEEFAHGDNESLAAVGAWLYSQHEPEKVLEIIPPDRAIASRALYLQRLDALAALARWQEVKSSIESQRFTLDPLAEQMYLARCDAQLGKPEGRDLHWNQAIAAAGSSLDKLLSVGRYAQQNGEAALAETAFRAAVKAVPDSRLAYEGLLGALQAQGKTGEIRRTLGEMQKVWPTDTSIRNDVVYLSALAGEDLEADRLAAQELAHAEPASLAHRVALALAELKQGHAVSAVTAFDQAPFAVIGSQPRFAAVYAAALWEAGANSDARAALKNVPVERLLPEERELVRNIR